MSMVIKPFRDSPFVSPFVEAFPYTNAPIIQQPIPLPVMPEAGLSRSLNYYADYSGCGFWRMIWPEHILNAHQKLTVHGSTVMNFDERYYQGVKSVRLQRQATEHQLNFVRALKQLSQKMNFRIIYEIDDIIFAEDIPDYNKFKPAFTDPKIRKTAQEIMAMCDEITVTCKYMKDYYANKTGNNNITVIPNFPPRFWMGNYYSPTKIDNNYRTYCCDKKNKPRIVYSGSGAHFDVDNRIKQKDDFEHVRDVIARTCDKYTWVFLGAYPLPLTDLVRTGKIEFHQWKRLYEYPEMISGLNPNVFIAPLQSSVFNKAKSDLKYIEASCFGIPIVCQDIETYSNAPVRFTTGDEMIDQIDSILKSPNRYKQLSKDARAFAETRFLENDYNIDLYKELYTLPMKDPQRVLLNKINSI